MGKSTDFNDWIDRKWRPLMGYMYMAVCIADFIVFPILWSILQSAFEGQITSQWQPLTLQGAGLFHVAMGAVLGISAYGRTQEKISGIAGLGTVYQQSPAPAAPLPTPAAGPIAPVEQIAAVSQPILTPQPLPVKPAAPAIPAPIVGYKGKLAPPQLEDPVL